MRLVLKLFILFVGTVCSLSAFSQENDVDSTMQLINDIQSREFNSNIQLMEEKLASMEKDSLSQFNDTIYIGLASLLSSSYIQIGQPQNAEKRLSHVVDYLYLKKIKSSYAYLLYISLGGLQCYLQNYYLGSLYLNKALELIEENKGKDEDYAVGLSILAECHRNLGQLDNAQNEIEESINIIERTNGQFNLSNRLGIYQKAGVIYGDTKQQKLAEYYTKKTFDLSKGDERLISEFINSGRVLSSMYLNKDKYWDALDVLHQLESKPLNMEERTDVYENLYLVNYFLDREKETACYADLFSREVKGRLSSLYSSFPARTIENLIDKELMRLRVVMGILDKFSTNSQVLEMCYDNAIFIKTFSFAQMQHIRELADNDNKISNKLERIKKIKSQIFSGQKDLHTELNREEKSLIEEIGKKDKELIKTFTCKDVSKFLKDSECAIEIISYVQDKVLKYGALILRHNEVSPIFVELCAFEKLYKIHLNALADKEYGINQLYTKGNKSLLYDMLWKKIESHVSHLKTVYISSVLGVNDINLEYIPCPDNTYLSDKYNICRVSSTSVLCNKNAIHQSQELKIWGAINYESEKNDTTKKIDSYRGIILDDYKENTRGSFNALKYTNLEIDSITHIAKENHLVCNAVKGKDANEISFRKMDGNSPSNIHLATHGFYLVGLDKYRDYFSKLIPYSFIDESMIRSGLLFADANTSFKGEEMKERLNDGVLTAEEISWLDLSNTKLAVLSACKTAIGTSRDADIGGLLKAFKNAGVENIVASLWEVPDEATARLMIYFYKHLLSGEELHSALHKAQRETALLYPDPYYWAAFIVFN